MRFLHHTLALLLAVLIANPLCCCFAASAPETSGKAPSCCSRNLPANEETPPADTCPGCQAKNPRVADGGKSLPLTVELFELPVVAWERFDSLLPSRESDLPVRADIAAPPPPRLVLILQQRFLI